MRYLGYSEPNYYNDPHYSNLIFRLYHVKKTSIFATEAVKVSENVKEFLIYAKAYQGGLGVNMLDIDGIYHFIESNQPQTITIIGDGMHGREIVTFLEYFLSRKYKPLIYELSLKRTPKYNSVMVIKLQRLT